MVDLDNMVEDGFYIPTETNQPAPSTLADTQRSSSRHKSQTSKSQSTHHHPRRSSTVSSQGGGSRKGRKGVRRSKRGGAQGGGGFSASTLNSDPDALLPGHDDEDNDEGEEDNEEEDDGEQNEVLQRGAALEGNPVNPAPQTAKHNVNNINNINSSQPQPQSQPQSQPQPAQPQSAPAMGRFSLRKQAEDTLAHEKLLANTALRQKEAFLQQLSALEAQVVQERALRQEVETQLQTQETQLEVQRLQHKAEEEKVLMRLRLAQDQREEVRQEVLVLRSANAFLQAQLAQVSVSYVLSV